MSEERPAPSPQEEAANMLYSTYRLQVGGANEAGVGMPVWGQLPGPLGNAWMAVRGAAGGGGSAPAPPATTLWTQEELEQLTVTDLRELCTQAGLTGGSSAPTQHLIDALLASQRPTP